MGQWFLRNGPVEYWPHYCFRNKLTGVSQDELDAHRREVRIWCREQFGYSNGVRWWESRGVDDINIHDERDAVAFRMRWC